MVSWLKPPPTLKNEPDPLKPYPAKHAIKHIEHYANEHDMIPRWGVLFSIKRIMSEHYAGRVFIHMGASGHFFNQHYLSVMFPLDAEAESKFLDRVVHVDISIHGKREEEVRRQTTVMMRRTEVIRAKANDSTAGGLKDLWFKRWGIQMGDGQEIQMPIGKLAPGDIAFLGGVTEARQAEGKTVRQLSRLWKYAGGAVPETDW